MLNWKIHIGRNVLIFIDTEFSDSVDMDLISIALVAQSGEEFYGERNDFDLAKFPWSAFVKAEVAPHLGLDQTRSLPRDTLRDEVRTWLEQFKSEKPRPCICYDFFGDWVLLTELLDGEIPDWLGSQNVYQHIDRDERERFFQQTEFPPHHALNDARANLCAHRPPFG
jgi:hypothetical protein